MRQLPGPLILQGALLITAAALPWGRGIAETPAIKSQAAVAMMPPSALAARTLSASRDRRTMAARIADSVIVWRDGEPEVAARFEYDATGGLLAVDDRGRRIVAANGDGIVRAWMTDGHVSPPVEWRLNVRPRSLDLNEGGDLVAIGTSDGGLCVCDSRTGEVRWRTRHGGSGVAVDFSGDGRRVLSGGEDGTVHEWSAGTGEPLREFRVQDQPIRQIATSTSDQYVVVAGGFSRRASILELSNPLRVIALPCPGPVVCCDVSLDERYVAAGTCTVRKFASSKKVGWLLVWEVETRRLVLQEAVHHNEIKAVRFSADGAYIYTAGTDGLKLVRMPRAANP